MNNTSVVLFENSVTCYLVATSCVISDRCFCTELRNFLVAARISEVLILCTLYIPVIVGDGREAVRPQCDVICGERSDTAINTLKRPTYI